MLKNLYSIYDTVAQVFNNPFAEVNDATAIRAFTTSISDNPHKNDYALYRIGIYTDHDGHIKPEQEAIRVFSGFDIKEADVVELPKNLQQQAD